jgi:hypothetical protein
MGQEGQRIEYAANGGQTTVPPTARADIPRVPWTPTPRPNPPLPDLTLRPRWGEEGWRIVVDFQHELRGVSPEMIDWFWANMEKAYFLWAPGDHKWFEWVKSPGEVGFVGSSHCAAEQTFPGGPVMWVRAPIGERKDMSWHPFTTSMQHVILEYTMDGKFASIHQWEAAPYGSVHRITTIGKGELPDAVKKLRIAGMEDAGAHHADYEEARWCEFLPQLYALWKDHPDPSQNVHCDLRVRQLPNGEWEYVAENRPPGR